MIDEWLAQLSDPDRLDDTVAAIVTADAERSAEPPEVRRARHDAADARARLERLVAGIEAGLDPELTVARIRRAQGEPRAYRSSVARL